MTSGFKPLLQVITAILLVLVVVEIVQKVRQQDVPATGVESPAAAAAGAEPTSEPVPEPEPQAPAMIAPAVALAEPSPLAVAPAPVAAAPVVPVPAQPEPDLAAEKLPAGAIPDEYVFRFFSAADRAAFVNLAKSLGIEVLGELTICNAVRIRATDLALLKRLLREGPTALERGRNYYVRPPTDPLRTAKPPEESYVALGDRLLDWLDATGAPEDRGRGVTVAVIDTAVGRHPALNEGRLLRVDNYGAPVDGEMQAHGTAVTSLIAGNGQGVDGVAPGVRIISLPVMSGAGVGDSFTLAKAIADAVSMGADIINMSLGSQGDSPVLREAVAHALANNVAIVASTGNEAVNSVFYPAAYEGVLAVGAVDANGRHLFFSNRGPAVDLVAPGYGVQAAWSDEQDVMFSGTSAATPIVSGALAALMSSTPALKPLEAAARLVATANDAGPAGEDEAYGAGILDLARAERDEDDGFQDIVLAVPYIAHEGPNGEMLRVQVYAQNRGNQVAPSVVLTVDVDGNVQVSRARQLAVGDSVRQERVLATSTMQLPHTLMITARVALQGASDAVPGNNRRQTLITVSAMGN